MAILAGQAQAGGAVIGAFGGLVCLEMAGGTNSAQAGKPPHRGASMTCVAFRRGMSAEQREPVLVILDGLDRHAPAARRVAFLASASHLVHVNIGVAIGTIGARVPEHETGVAAAAACRLMKTTQRILGSLMRKIGSGAQRLPAG